MHNLSNSSNLQLTSYELDTLDVEDLKRHVEALEKEVAEIDLENELIERYLERNDPKMLIGINNELSKQKKTATRIQFVINAETQPATNGGNNRLMPKQSVMSFGSFGTAGSFSRSARTNDSQLQERVGYAMRSNLCAKETVNVHAETERIHTESKERARDLTAELETLCLTNDEVNETREELKNFVFVNGINPLTNKVPAERLLQFFDKWKKNGNGMRAKMRLQTATMRQGCITQRRALAAKAELSCILRPVDFEQLKMDKELFQRELHAKTKEIVSKKRASGNVSIALAVQRKQLIGKQDNLNRLNDKKDRIRKLTQKLEFESDKIENEKELWHKRIDKLTKAMNNHAAPSVMDYIQRKQDLQDLDKEIKILERKQRILELELKNKNIKK